MSLIKRYNIIDVLVEYKIGFLINLLLGGIIIILKNNQILSLYYFISVFVFCVYTAIINYKKSKIVLDYLVAHEYQIIKNHQLDTGYGIKAYFRDFNDS